MEEKGEQSTVLGPLMHKNELQQYAQKLHLPFPVYHTINEGYQHSPKFRSTALVNGQSYESKLTFRHRREAEQDAARVALISINDEMKREPCLQIPKGAKYCKSILYEFATKMGMKAPTYRIKTMGGEQSGPTFMCSMFFNGKAYEGEVGGSRKEAEQLAAWTAIMKLQEADPGILRGVIHAKFKDVNPLHKVKSISFKPRNKLAVQQSVGTSQSEQLTNVMKASGTDSSKRPVWENKHLKGNKSSENN